MSRVYDWEARLSGYIAEVAGKRLEPGEHDCALFAAGAVAAITGVDPAADWRGCYDTQAGGRALLRAAGHRSAIAAAEAMFPEIALSLRLPGDIAVVGPALGIVQGEAIYVLRQRRLGLVGLDRARKILAVR